jgi:broad specificity phosphatase PhoE
MTAPDRLFLVRHAEPAGQWGDVADPGLSANGRAQAAAAGAALQAHAPALVLCSPLARCRETAAGLIGALDAAPALRIEPKVAEIPVPDGIADRRAWLADTLVTPLDALDPAVLGWANAARATVEAAPAGSVICSHFVAINAVVALVGGARHLHAFDPAHASITVLGRSQGRLHIEALGAQATMRLT